MRFSPGQFFSVAHMVNADLIQGALPSSREAYRADIRMAWPSIAESFLISLTSAVDTIMVASLGPLAIAAVGINTQPRLAVLSFILSLNIGVTAVVARRRGADDTDGANRCLKQAIMTSAAVAFSACGLAFILARPLLLLVGARPDFLPDAVAYFQILIVGVFFHSVCLTINAAQRGIGNTRISLRTNLTANIVNIVFNYLLIGGRFGFPRLEVRGAALATVIGNVVACFMAISTVCDRDCFINIWDKSPWRFERATMGSIAKVGLSALAEQLFLRVGMMTYTRLVAALGTIAYAAHIVCMNIVNMSFALGDGIGVAASALVGQNLGARRPDLSMLYGKVSQRLAMVGALALSVGFVVFRYDIIRLFSDDASILALGGQIVLIIAVVCFAQTSQVVLAGCLRGAGDTTYVAALSLVSLTIVRPASAWLMCYPMGLGLLGAWLGMLVDQVLRVTLLARRFRGARWSAIKL
ncbi:MAG: MATE family efflux transporter [Peptococcaceae bacterium]|nr:MATE family efflux transporter [Peptococcaceae bacterium]